VQFGAVILFAAAVVVATAFSEKTKGDLYFMYHALLATAHLSTNVSYARGYFVLSFQPSVT
jgi:hypothetical protein